MIEEEEFNGWLQHPMTKEFRRILGLKRETLRQDWEGGSFTDYALEGTSLVNVGNLGTCKGYAYAESFSYEDYLTEIVEIEDEKPIGPGA